jgi:acyl-[acyl carrier protein]--UDP-N-acetylglucosamine O-acyltransferase
MVGGMSKIVQDVCPFRHRGRQSCPCRGPQQCRISP